MFPKLPLLDRKEKSAALPLLHPLGTTVQAGCELESRGGFPTHVLLIFMVPEENSAELNRLFPGHFVAHPAGTGSRLGMLTSAQCSPQPDDGSVSPAAFSAGFS